MEILRSRGNSRRIPSHISTFCTPPKTNVRRAARHLTPELLSPRDILAAKVCTYPIFGRLSSPFEGLPDITQRVYFNDGTNIMGLAWQYFPLPGGSRRHLGKDGQTNGFSSFLGLMREQNIGVAVLCNNSAAVPQNLATEILQILVEPTED